MIDHLQLMKKSKINRLDMFKPLSFVYSSLAFYESLSFVSGFQTSSCWHSCGENRSLPFRFSLNGFVLWKL